MKWVTEIQKLRPFEDNISALCGAQSKCLQDVGGRNMALQSDDLVFIQGDNKLVYLLAF